MLAEADLAATVLAATAAAALGAALPRFLARIPDPEPPDLPETETDTGLESGLESGLDAAGGPGPGAYPSFAELAALPRLPLRIAIASGLAGAVVGAYAGWEWPLVWLTVLAPLGVMLGYVDWRTCLLPTRMIYPGYLAVASLMIVAALTSADGSDLVRAVIGAGIALVLYWLPWRINAAWMGFGDVRLSGLLGGVLGWAGWAELALGLYLPFLLGGAVALTLLLLRRRGRDAHPLGPFMFVGTLLGLLLGPVVLPGLP